MPEIQRTCNFKLDGEFGTFVRDSDVRAIWKRGVRVKEGDTAEYANTNALAYGNNDEFTVGLHFRIEDVFGGHGVTRLIAHQFAGGKGWKVEYNVAAAQLDFTVDDGAGNSDTISVDVTDEDLYYFVMIFYPNFGPQGFEVYRLLPTGPEIKGTLDTTGYADIHPAVTIKLGDAAATVAMMWGGFFMMSTIISDADMLLIIPSKDSVWNGAVAGTVILHTPGENYDWGGGINRDIDEGASQWKDVSGNAYDCNFVLADATNSMARETARITHVITTGLVELILSQQGSRASIIVSEDDTVDVGDVVFMFGRNNKWSGMVEGVQKDTGIKILKCIGVDEDKKEEWRNDVFADRATHQDNVTEDNTNLIYEDTDGAAEAGSGYNRLNSKLSLMDDALAHGYGVSESILSSLYADTAALVMGLTDFQFTNREYSRKESASEVTVIGYGNANIPYEQTGIAGGATVYNLDNKPVEVIYVKVGGVEVFAGFHVDADNKQLIFDAPTGGNVDVKYTIRDEVNTATASDDDVEQEIGKKKALMVWVGYIGSVPLQAIANALIRGRYWINTIQPRQRKFYNDRFYVGRRIQINQSGDPFGINGDYFCSRVIFEGTMHKIPRIEIEEYDPNIGFPIQPNKTHFVDVIDQMRDDSLHTNRGFDF